jgi:hypothetical protein
VNIYRLELIKNIAKSERVMFRLGDAEQYAVIEMPATSVEGAIERARCLFGDHLKIVFTGNVKTQAWRQIGGNIAAVPLGVATTEDGPHNIMPHSSERWEDRVKQLKEKQNV